MYLVNTCSFSPVYRQMLCMLHEHVLWYHVNSNPTWTDSRKCNVVHLMIHLSAVCSRTMDTLSVHSHLMQDLHVAYLSPSV